MNDFTVKWIDEKGVERSKKYKTLNDATYARNWLLKNGAKQVEIFINKQGVSMKIEIQIKNSQSMIPVEVIPAE